MISKRKANINLVIIYRLLIVFVAYAICRALFLAFHYQAFEPLNATAFVNIFIGGFRFDAAGIMYLNALVILASVVPFQFRHNPSYQKIVFILFVAFNLIGFALNIADIGYYPFTKTRTTASVFAQFSEEANKLKLFSQFLIDYWHLLVIFITMAILFVFAASRLTTGLPHIRHKGRYILASSLLIPIYIFVVILGIRGNLRSGAKPLYLNDAAAYAESPSQVPLILSTPFSVIRTLGKMSFEKKNYFNSEKELEQWMNPIHVPDSTATFDAKNVVIIILEGFGREYIGAVNTLPNAEPFVSYTPFLDSLFQQGRVYQHAFANGRVSIEAPPAIFASIPSLSMPYTLSQNANNELKSLIHCLDEKGYHSAFFHSADNGTMRFDAFMKMAGFDQYFGRTEYNNEKDFDGMWGMWDEEYLQYYAHEMTKMPQPFVTSVFTVTSHHPFSIPERYHNKFPQGHLPMHKCIGYTDHALRRFFEKAKQMPWYHNTLFVLVADHASIPWYDEYKTLPGEFAIPLCFFAPDGSIAATKDTTTVASQIDIMPTIMDLLNYNKPYFAFGKSLINTPPNKNFTISANKDRMQIFHNHLMMVREHETILQWMDLEKGYVAPNQKFTPEIESMDSLIQYGKAFEQQYYNRIIENRIYMCTY
ncbi:phosphoglycerol transferase MdoB-like AlkP superfamily enzyme [Breznakibacter xylanolyticus]|uniref:Phosphoglycerol transferase MdoB-like AlkP superfamily enzyme n=1 Tax=Breznakibacter xylanolyticus TaxID=990 RepID=A0A2W7NTM0_9BACT|nr:alkaline phosphatase family protein [Breznakibacter xylanolyticus]PZX16676.1 phosphoglycerol transferase MdoB-like AlkP superfamily enzyme [Breznakibacter xylanolyticus]